MNKVFPDKMLQCMSSDERKKLGKAGMLASECQEKYEKGQEKKLQKDMTNLLRQRGLIFFNPPMHKRSAMPLGYPDFTIFLPLNRVLLVEAKTQFGQLSPDQMKWHEEYNTNTQSRVCTVRNMDEFKQALDSLSE